MGGWREKLITGDDDLRSILRAAKTIAVVGAKAGAGEPAYYVPAYLARQGYRIRPVNPTITGRRLFDVPVVATLGDLDELADVIETSGGPSTCRATPRRSWRCPGGRRRCGSSSASATTRPPSGWPAPGSGWCRIAA